MEDKSNEEDSSNATPRTSNKRTVSSLQELTGNHPTSAGLPAIQEGTLPLRNPLHNSDSEGSLFEAHFQANEGGEFDSRPVAPTRKASANSFQSDSEKIRLEMNAQEEEDGGASVSSSYVGDVDERAESNIPGESFMKTGSLMQSHLAEDGDGGTGIQASGGTDDHDAMLDDILDDWEQRYINAALKLSGGNLSEAARLLGVNRTTLYGKIQRLSNGKNGDV